MEKTKRKARISIKDFCKIFDKREFTVIDKMTKSIFIVEDVNGNFRIEEVFNIVGIVLFSFVSIVVAIPIFLLEGFKGLKSLLDESKHLFLRKPLRVDGLYHNIESTDKLLEKAGWTPNSCTTNK